MNLALGITLLACTIGVIGAYVLGAAMTLDKFEKAMQSKQSGDG